MEQQPVPETMFQAVGQFADPQVAHNFFFQIRWPDGIVAYPSACGSVHVAYMPKQRRWYCKWEDIDTGIRRLLYATEDAIEASARRVSMSST